MSFTITFSEELVLLEDKKEKKKKEEEEISSALKFFVFTSEMVTIIFACSHG